MSSTDAKESTGDYPYQPPRVDEEYQIKVPKFKSDRKKGIALVTFGEYAVIPNGRKMAVPLWNCSVLPESQVVEYLKYAKFVFADPMAFSIENALEVLHRHEYDVVQAKYDLIAPFVDLPNNSSPVNAKEEITKSIEECLKKQVAVFNQRKESFLVQLNEITLKRSTFADIQTLIHQAAVFEYESQETRALRVTAHIISNWLKLVKPIITDRKCTNPNLVPQLIEQAERLFPLIDIEEKSKLLSIHTVIQSWSKRVEPVFNSTYNFKNDQDDEDTEQEEENNEDATAVENTVPLERTEPITIARAQALINAGNRAFPGFTCVALDRLSAGISFARSLVDLVHRKIAPPKKTRSNHVESKLPLFEAEKVFNEYQNEFAWIKIPEVCSLYCEISEAQLLGSEAIASMNDGRTDKSQEFLDRLEKMQLVLPEIELLASYHTGLVWSEKAKSMLTSVTPFPKISAIRYLVNEANLLKLSSPPHVEQMNKLNDMISRAEEWQDRAKRAVSQKSSVNTCRTLLDELNSQIHVSMTEETKLNKMIDNAKRIEEDIAEWLNRTNKLNLTELRLFFTNYQSGDYAKITSDSIEELNEYLNVANEWYNNANILLEKEFPRLNPIKSTLEFLNSSVVLQRFDFDDIALQLNNILSKIQSTLEQASNALAKVSGLEEISELYHILYKHGVSESDTTFAVLSQRWREGSVWQETAVRNIPLKESGKTLAVKYMPSFDRISRLIEQKTTSSNLQLLDLKEFDALKEAYQLCSNWRNRAIAALDDENKTLNELEDLLAEGVEIPVKIAEKDSLEAKCWAMGWVDKSQKLLDSPTSLEKLCELYAELHSYKLDADTIDETKEIEKMERRIQDSLNWSYNLRELFVNFIGIDRTIEIFGNPENFEFQALTAKPSLNLELVVGQAKYQAKAELVDNDDKSKRNRRPTASNDKKYSFPTKSSADLNNVERCGKKRKVRQSTTKANRAATLEPSCEIPRFPWRQITATNTETGEKRLVFEETPHAVLRIEDERSILRVKKPDGFIFSSVTAVEEVISQKIPKPSYIQFPNENLFCICRQPHTEGSFMIQCDSCENWFHLSCLGITKVDSNREFICWSCCRADFEVSDYYSKQRLSGEIPPYIFGERYPARNNSLVISGVPLEKLREFEKNAPENVILSELSSLKLVLQECSKFEFAARSIIAKSDFLFYPERDEYSRWNTMDLFGLEFLQLLDALQYIHYESCALPADFSERAVLENRIRTMTCRQKMRKLRFKKFVTLKELSGCLAELESCGVDMNKGDDMISFATYVRGINEWSNRVGVCLHERVPIQLLYELQAYAKSNFDLVSCPDRQELERRIQAAKDFENKLIAATRKRTRLNAMVKLLIERQSYCNLVTTQVIEAVEEQVFYLEQWKSRFYSMLDTKASRDDFIALKNEIIDFSDGFFIHQLAEENNPDFNSSSNANQVSASANAPDVKEIVAQDQLIVLTASSSEQNDEQKEVLVTEADHVDGVVNSKVSDMEVEESVPKVQIETEDTKVSHVAESSEIKVPVSSKRRFSVAPLVFIDIKDLQILDDCCRLFCLCQKSWENDVFMISCDSCNDWFHNECVGLSFVDAKRLKTFVCPRCWNFNLQPYPYGTCVPDLRVGPGEKYGANYVANDSEEYDDNTVSAKNKNPANSQSKSYSRTSSSKTKLPALGRPPSKINPPSIVAANAEAMASFHLLSQIASIAASNGTPLAGVQETLTQMIYNIQMYGGSTNSTAAAALASALHPNHLPFLLRELQNQQFIIHSQSNGSIKDISKSRLFVQQIFLNFCDIFITMETRTSLAYFLNEFKDKPFNEQLLVDVLLIVIFVSESYGIANNSEIRERIVIVVEQLFDSIASEAIFSNAPVSENSNNPDVASATDNSNLEKEKSCVVESSIITSDVAMNVSESIESVGNIESIIVDVDTQ